MRSKFFIIPAALVFQVAVAQDSASLTTSGITVTVAPIASPTVATPASTQPGSDGFTQISIMDYKSVYESATLEEEVQLATERFKLSKTQQEVWATAAVDRRAAEKQARATLELKATEYNKDAVYKGLRSAQNQFYETIIGYFDPTQKAALEKDRVIIEERRKMIAKLPPPVITPTVVPVDSTAIKAEEKNKKLDQKSKKKKKPAKA